MAKAKRINQRAFDLGAQCRRAGINKERMLNYYAHENNHPDYDPTHMTAGWDDQNAKYQEKIND